MLKKILFLLLFLILAGVFYILHFEAPRFIVEIKHPMIERQIQTFMPENTRTFTEFQSNGKYIKVPTTDGTEISAYLSYSNTTTQKGTIILTHGIRSKKEQWMNSVKGISDKGWNCIAIDLRAHGESTGKYCTFGVKEKKDISDILNYLEKQESISKNYGVWGSSLGGAVALQCLAHEPRFKFGIVESTFSDFRSVAIDYFEGSLGFRSELLGNYLVNRSGKIADFDPDSASPLLAAEKVNQPILMFHGTADQNISINYGRANFSALQSKNKKWVEIEGGGHNGMANADLELYFKELNSFLKKVSN